MRSVRGRTQAGSTCLSAPAELIGTADAPIRTRNSHGHGEPSILTGDCVPRLRRCRSTEWRPGRGWTARSTATAGEWNGWRRVTLRESRSRSPATRTVRLK